MCSVGPSKCLVSYLKTVEILALTRRRLIEFQHCLCKMTVPWVGVGKRERTLPGIQSKRGRRRIARQREVTKGRRLAYSLITIDSVILASYDGVQRL